MRTSWNVNGSEAGSSKLTAVFNEAGQLTSATTTGANAGSASYTFDGAGNRSSQTVNGTATSFGHDPAGRLLSTQTEGRSTSYTYDGLDRRTSVTDATAFGSDTTSTTWDGLDPVATDSAQHGVTDLLRDPTGEVVFQSGGYDDAWVLGDARNATATADTGGRITDLVDYTDFGAAGFESTGWAALVGNDGQPGDATLGLDHYYARDYDTATGLWVQPDEWRGLLVRPQSLNRFAYVENSPVSFSGYLGYLPIGGGLKAGIAKANIKNGMKKGGIAAAMAARNMNSLAKSASKAVKSIQRSNSRVRGPSLRTGQWLAQRPLAVSSNCDFGRPCSQGIAAIQDFGRWSVLGVLLNPFAAPVISWMSSFLSSDEGSLIGAWAFGAAPNRITFDSRSRLTQGIRGLPETQSYVAKVRAAISTNGVAAYASVGSGGYNPGSPHPLNGHLWRDAVTAIAWPIAGNDSRTRLVIGTNTVTATHAVSTGPNSARVTFTATNDTTLGSMVRGIGTYEFWNGIPGPSGPFSAVQQSYVWTEEVTW